MDRTGVSCAGSALSLGELHRVQREQWQRCVGVRVVRERERVGNHSAGMFFGDVQDTFTKSIPEIDVCPGSDHGVDRSWARIGDAKVCVDPPEVSVSILPGPVIKNATGHVPLQLVDNEHPVNPTCIVSRSHRHPKLGASA